MADGKVRKEKHKSFLSHIHAFSARPGTSIDDSASVKKASGNSDQFGSICAIYLAYSNRVACYTKLGALPEGLKDCEKCIELDPTFAKGYTRKGAVQFFMKEYDKALETYKEGLKHDSNNTELTDGVRRCVEQINKASRGT